MKASYEQEADALHVSFSDAPIVESEEVRPGIVFDFDAEGRVVGIEILNASEHLASETDLRHLTAA